MSIDILTITSTVNTFFDGLFFGFAIVTLVALLIYLFSKNVRIKSFIMRSITVAKYLAIVYAIFYLASLMYYISTEEFRYHATKSESSNAAPYWLILIRPFVLCGFLQLLWFKKFKNNIRAIALITLLVLICTLLSGAMIELLAIVMASNNLDYFSGETQYISDSTIVITSYIIEKCVLFSALVFITWIIKREPKLQ